jgi:hypothetical protein
MDGRLGLRTPLCQILVVTLDSAIMALSVCREEGDAHAAGIKGAQTEGTAQPEG